MRLLVTSMPFNPDRHHRHSIRLRGYDYSQAGAYFVTLCTYGRAHLFGGIADGAVLLNDAGTMVLDWWNALSDRFPCVLLNDYVLMPDHLHGIVVLQKFAGQPVALGTVIQWFKTMTTNAYIRGVRNGRWQPFEWHVWQRNYYERIVRSDEEMTRIRHYIDTNPQRWPR
jgi:putative transposase